MTQIGRISADRNVGVALRGHPSSEFQSGVATEGHPSKIRDNPPDPSDQ